MAPSASKTTNKWTFISTFIIFLLLSIAAILLARKAYKEVLEYRRKEEQHENISNDVPVDGVDRPKITVMLFFASWCGACQKIKNQWNAFQETYKNTNNAIQNFGILCKKVDCSMFSTNEHLQSVMNQYDIEQFPTIVLLIPDSFQQKMGDVTHMKMSGKITKKSIEKFVSKCIDEMK